MKWSILLIIIMAVAVIFLLLKPVGRIPVKQAREYLDRGALVIDVRSAGEFDSGHLPSAVNIPLDEIGKSLPALVPDKNRVLLLHCQSGVRSAMAAKKLKGMGYKNAWNLGSLSAARTVVDGAGGK